MNFSFESYSLDRLKSLDDVRVGDRVGLANSFAPIGLAGIFEKSIESDIILFDFNLERHVISRKKLKYLFFVNDNNKTILAGDESFISLSPRCYIGNQILIEEVLSKPFSI